MPGNIKTFRWNRNLSNPRNKFVIILEKMTRIAFLQLMPMKYQWLDPRYQMQLSCCNGWMRRNGLGNQVLIVNWKSEERLKICKNESYSYFVNVWMQMRSFSSHIEQEASEAPTTKNRSFCEMSTLRQVESGGWAWIVRTRRRFGRLKYEI
jgi:hypothetical protein